MPKICETVTNQLRCQNRAQFCNKKDGGPKRCKEHKLENDIESRRRNLLCKFNDCIVRASYSDPEFPERKVAYCTKHKKKGGIIKGSCIYPGCTTKAKFGPEDGKTLYCKKHKENDHINLNCDRCTFPECKTIASFGIEGNKKAIYCKEHKGEEHKDVINKKCLFPECNKQPCFGLESDGVKIYCKDHKGSEHIDVTTKRCIFPDCKTMASFGEPNSTERKYCKDHKQDDSINIGGRRCQFPECTKRGSFGDKDGDEFFCSEHKKEEHKNTYLPQCRANNEPYNIPCPSGGNKSYDMFCTHCFSHLFPDNPKTSQIRKKSKELRVVEYISKNFKNFLHDKPLYVDMSGGCCVSRRRIDLRTLIGNTMLCIEIDENQHKYYDKIDEKSRYDDIFMDFTGKYVFIRYNPDKYKIGKQVKNPQFSTRMELLHKTVDDQIERIINDQNEDMLEIYHLYYDQ